MPRLGPPFELVLPGVEELPLQIQLAGQSPNVFAGLHPFDDLPFELHGVPTPLCHLCHFGLHSMQSAFIRRVSLLGFTPRRGFTVPFEDLLIGATALHQAASWVRCGYREHPAFRNDSWSRGEEALFTCGV
jgi:hypothetical protein